MNLLPSPESRIMPLESKTSVERFFSAFGIPPSLKIFRYSIASSRPSSMSVPRLLMTASSSLGNPGGSFAATKRPLLTCNIFDFRPETCIFNFLEVPHYIEAVRMRRVRFELGFEGSGAGRNYGGIPPSYVRGRISSREQGPQRRRALCAPAGRRRDLLPLFAFPGEDLSYFPTLG